MVNYEVTQGKNVLGRENKGNEMGMCPVCFRYRKESRGLDWSQKIEANRR